MKNKYFKIHSSYIFKLLRIHKNLLQEDIDEIMESFDNEIEMSKYPATYEHYKSCLNKIENINKCLDNEKDCDIYVINE